MPRAFAVLIALLFVAVTSFAQEQEAWIDGVSEQAAFQCACPSVVEFCQEWASKFQTPETPRKCVIEMMLGIEEDRRNAVTLGMPFEEYEQATDAELDDRACAPWSRRVSLMPAAVCPECLTRDLVLVVVFAGDACRRCGQIPSEPLTPGEIRACLRAKHGEEKVPL